MLEHYRTKNKIYAYSYEGIDVDQMFKARATYYVEQLSKIRSVCKANNITFILSNQQMKSESIPEDIMKGISYQDEINIILKKRMTEHSLLKDEWYMLVHNEIMKAIEKWAFQEKVPFVDAIKAIDPERRNMATWVHLYPQGNQILAKALSSEIIKQTQMQ
jgi:hypothetical protein